MSLDVSIVVEGEPKAQPRVKAARRGTFIHIYTPGGAKEWKKAVQHAALQEQLERRMARLDCPLRVDMYFRMPRPKAHFLRGVLRSTAPSWHVKKPDKDNLEKAVMDALTDAGIWRDDSAVCAGYVEKVYHRAKESIGCTIFIKTL